MPDQEITIMRVFDAPRDAVWKAWTEPEQLAQWWGKRGWSTAVSSIAMDVRPGGAFRLTSVSDTGQEMPMAATYREVVEPERLVVEEEAEGAWHDGAVTVVTFADLGDGRTEMTFRASVRTTDEMRGHAEAGTASAFDRLTEHLAERTNMDFRLEVIVVPVSDADRAKAFYTDQVGFTLDHDASPNPEVRVVQLTPPGSACSIVVGPELPGMEPGGVKGLQLVVADIEAAHAELAGRGVAVGEVQLLGPPEKDGSKFFFFEDPDGNGWAVQELRS